MQYNKFLRNSNSFSEKFRKNIEKRLNSLKENFFVKKSILYKMVYFFATFNFFLGCNYLE